MSALRARGTVMKSMLTACIFVTASLSFAQDKPRVFVAGRGTQNTSSNSNSSGNFAGRSNVWFSRGHAESTSDAHDEGMEVTKNLQKGCPGVVITLNQSSADYTVMLNRESKQKRGLLRTNSQVQVANRIGDVLDSHATRTVNNASKDVCTLILSDWTQNGRIAGQVETPVASIVHSETPVPTAPGVASPATTQESSQEAQARADRNTVVVSAAPTVQGQNESVADAARRVKQRHACLLLAADNPSVTCK